uniref:Uncharacterized protein n=1 Tax=Ditylenchus dipsaci TaxID=166011 RepID=A0A915DMG5_9BILA
MNEEQVANKFGVHILIIDSTSQTQFFRSMQKTVYLLREEYGAIPFYYLNKVALNSHNNAHALFMGKHAEHVLSSPLNEKPIMADEGWTDCKCIYY